MIARPISFHSNSSVSVVQMATGDQDSFEYISLGSALKQNLVQVKEVSQAGRRSHADMLDLLIRELHLVSVEAEP